jgi:unsaturated chondroitin disaccharide hydrolase
MGHLSEVSTIGEGESSVHSTDQAKQVRGALLFAQQKVRGLIQKNPGLYPVYTSEGRWKHGKPAWTNWCEGFLPGMMWLFLKSNTADDPAFWRKTAEKYASGLESRKDDKEVHTLGFVFYHGAYKPWYDITVREGKPNESVKSALIHAARVLLQRYHKDGGYLRAFLGNDTMLIDAVMNLPLLYYATEQTGEEVFKNAADHIALTAIRQMVRGDGSTAQQGIFQVRTGEFLKQATQQGHRGDSAWSRGLAWSLHGFAMCYEMTADARFLEVAESNARFFIRHTPKDGVPPWDYDAPESGIESRQHLDSSAAAIAAGGFFRLARAVDDADRSVLYRTVGLQIVETLCKPPFLSIDDPSWEGILRRGVYHIHKDLGVDESVMWGDFYFVDALVMALEAIDTPPLA